MTDAPPRLEIIYRDPRTLVPYERNPRKIPEAAVEACRRSLRAFGWRHPIVVDSELVVVAGHTRLKASLLEEHREIPTVSTDGMTDEQIRAFRIADNRIAALTEEDPEILESEIRALEQEALRGGLAAAMAVDDSYLDAIFRDFDNVAPGGKTHVATSLLYQNRRDRLGDDTVHEVYGYDGGSVWGRSGANETAFQPYALSLPRPRENATRYSRSPFQEMEKIVRTYMRPGDRFLELCAGWWTFSCSAAMHGYEGEGIDVWDVSMEFGAKQIARLPAEARRRVKQTKGDARKMPYRDGEFSFAYCNPPYHTTEKYGGEPDDLAESGDLNSWLLHSADMMAEALRVLRPGSLCVTVMADYREAGRLVPVHSMWIETITKMTGFVLHDLVVQHLVSAQLKTWRKCHEARRTAKSHEYVIVFRKPEAAAEPAAAR